MLRGVAARPARLAQGAVVAVLAISLGATVSATANARGNTVQTVGASSTARTSAQVDRARAGALDVATDAVHVARAVQVEGAQAAVGTAQLAALEAATAQLNELIAAVQPTVATDGASPAATPGATPAGAARATPTDSSTPGDAGAQPAATPTTPTTSASPPASSSPASSTPAESVLLDAGSTTPASSRIPSAVPTVPPTEGTEDAATTQLRAAVAAVAQLSADVRVASEVNRAAAEAAAQATAEFAPVQVALQARADAEAAAQLAADKNAQRAAWKKSLLGFANGEIPDSALCGVGFDPTVRLRCDAAAQLDLLDAAYRARFGVHVAVSDSYRSYAGQVACLETRGSLCAPPGTSNHGNGIAVDLGGGIETFGTQQYAWMQANAGALLWVHPAWADIAGTKPEAWHWEYSG